jgi:hypothetical protein
MKTITWRSLLLLPLTLGAIATFDLPAQAIVGRPLTPMSYAGVARRTARRTTRVAVGTAAVAGTAAAVGAAAAVPVLPAGCIVGAPCGSVVYQPVYQGTEVVYVPE